MISENVGHSIDGNVFIDDDGRWYFYWAGDEGIWGCEMPSPTEFGAPVLTGVHMNGWTEGPFVSKRDGVYYMTLTGNHYLSSGYRIDAASSSHPLHGYEPDRFNPILIGADGPAVGLGHSSTVLGPDLVSTWMIYHNINPDASRDLDIDRQVWSGRCIEVFGPSTSAPVPGAPDVEWGEAESPAITSMQFTAELNFIGVASRDYSLSIGDAVTILADELPRTFVHDVLHCWRLIYDHGVLRVFVDGRLQFTREGEIPLGSAVTVTDHVLLAHCALTHMTPEVADRRAARPVPGRFWADAGEYDLHVQRPGQYVIYVAGQPSTPLTAGRDVLPSAPEPGLRLVTIAAAPDGRTAAFADESASGFGKRILGDHTWDDFALTATVSFTLEAPDGHADLIVRAKQLSEGGEGDDTQLGLNFLLGYSVQFHSDRVVLARHDYNEQVLAVRELSIDQSRSHVLAVRACGGSFSVDVDGVEAITIDDALPHPLGHVGIRTANALLEVETLRIENVTKPVPTI